MDEIKKMDLESKNLISERIELLKELFPNVVDHDSNLVDFDALRLELGDEVDEENNRYYFNWTGKRDAIRLSQKVSSGTLRPCLE